MSFILPYIGPALAIGSTIFRAIGAREEQEGRQQAADANIRIIENEGIRDRAAAAEEARITERKAKIRRSVARGSAAGRGVTTSGSVVALLRDDFEETERDLIKQRFNLGTRQQDRETRKFQQRVASRTAGVRKDTGFFGTLLGGAADILGKI